MNTTDVSHITRLEDVITDERVKKMLSADKGNDAQLIFWKIRDFTQNDDNLGSFIISLDIKFSKQGKELDTCHAIKLNPSCLSEICDVFCQQNTNEEASLYRKLTSDITTTVQFSLDSTDKHVTTPLDLITEECIKSTLAADKGRNVQLISWEIKDFTQKCDNLGCYVTSVNVIFSCQGNNQHTSYVVKFNSYRQNEIMGGFAQSMFLKEIHFYMNLDPELSSELQSVGMHPLRLPKCFHANKKLGKDMIFLEDLTLRGFKTFDQQKGMDCAHAILVVQELARFHASSVLLQNKSPSEDLSVRHDFLREDFHTLKHKEPVKHMLTRGIESSLEMFRHTGGYEKAIDWITRHKSSVFGIMEEMVRRTPQFDVICHGGCCSNTVLFRYDDKGKPLEVMLFDLQWNRVASLTTDLNYFLLTSLDGDVRKHNLDVFLSNYFETFKEIMEAGGISMPFTLQELHHEYKNKHLFGLIFAMVVVPFVVQENKDAPIEEMLSENAIEEEEEMKQKALISLSTKPLLRQRFLDMFTDMESEGVFDCDFSSNINH